jgi:hypothetical protein
MKKKTKYKPVKKSKSKKPKIDVVLESLLNLETVVRELTKKIEQLQYSQPYYPNPNLPAPQSPPKYWPVDYPKYKDVTWDAIDKGLQ